MSNQWWNNDKYQCVYKNHLVCEKEIVSNPTKCVCEIGKYLASIMNDSLITCDEVIESYDE